MRLSYIFLGTIIVFGLWQSALATSGVSLTAPTMVNITGHKIASFHVGQDIGVESILTNNGKSDQKFTYLVQVLDNRGETQYLEGFSASMLPNQSFAASQVWIPKNPGEYTVQVFVWDSLSSGVPLTDVLQTHITVNE